MQLINVATVLLASLSLASAEIFKSTAAIREVGDGACVRSGCAMELCLSESDKSKGLGQSMCTNNPINACYKDAVCERQAKGNCGWTRTDALEACIDKFDGVL
ncbi:hypothetical protein HK104_009708 [Borealophlyctis nickersoniae]|nr:hypothetical protein HK104_009708 [Borealophlyctis nickersoniae]